jgi:molecular chaperone DnaK (HSP70)
VTLDISALVSALQEGIAPAPCGEPRIEVAFEIDANGVLSMSARDRGTGGRQSVTIDSPCRDAGRDAGGERCRSLVPCSDA